MAQTMPEKPAVPLFADIIPGRVVQFLEGYARPDLCHRPVVGILHDAIDLSLAGIGLAHGNSHRFVGMIAPVYRAEIEGDQLSATEQLAAGLTVRKCAPGAGSNDKVKGFVVC